MESSAFDLASIEKNGNRPEEWLAFISRSKRELANYNHILGLYGKAASLISPDKNRKNICYARLLVEFAKLQGMTSPDDARDIFRVARCNVKSFAIVHLAWAQFELTQGNRGKCKSLLRKGKLNGAEPKDILNQALYSCDQGNDRLLDDETEELAFTGVLLNAEPGGHRLKLPIPTLQSDNELTQEKMMTGNNTTGTQEQMTVQGSLSHHESVVAPSKSDSEVISFKLPEDLERHPRLRQKWSSSSSSGDDTVTAPLHHICRPSIKSMTASKPSSKATPDCKTVDSTCLSNSMNLSVRKSTARRGLMNNLYLGPPIRGTCKPLLEDVKEWNIEGDEEKNHDNMDSFKVLDQTSHIFTEEITNEVLCENIKDAIVLEENVPSNNYILSQVKNLDTTQPESRSTKSDSKNIGKIDLAYHQDVARSTSYNKLDKHLISHSDQDVKPQAVQELPGDGHDQKVNQLYPSQAVHCNQGYPNQNQAIHGNQGYPNQAIHGNQGYPNQAIHGNQGYPNQAIHGNQGYPNQAIHGNHRYPNQAIPGNQGYPNQAIHGNHRYPNQAIHGNQGYPNQAIHGNQGYPNQAMPGNQGYPNGSKEYPNKAVQEIKGLPKRDVHSNQHFPQAHAAMGNSSIFVNGKPYLKLGTIGRGGSSKVFRAFDGHRVCAVKYVSLEDADDVIIQSYINEITMLKRLQGSDHIIKLYDWEQKKDENSIILVLECGSIDLAAFLRKNRSTFTQTELTAYWKQMLEAVNVIHNEGIIHSDLKPANFLFVEGRLKLIDFGIANAIQADQTSIQRDTQVGTLNFMSPEAFQDISGSSQINPITGRSRPCTKIGRPSDVWSLGCILYIMVYGCTPFQHITNQAMKLQCIMDEKYAIEFPSIDNQQLLDVLKVCLIRNPRERYTIPQMLKHPFLASGKQDPSEEQLFNCLLELAQAHVNSPRSIRVASKSICEQLRSGNKIDLSSVLARKQQQQSMAMRKPLEGLSIQELQQAHSSIKAPSTSSTGPYMENNIPYSNKENV